MSGRDAALARKVGSVLRDLGLRVRRNVESDTMFVHADGDESQVKIVFDADRDLIALYWVRGDESSAALGRDLKRLLREAGFNSVTELI